MLKASILLVFVLALQFLMASNSFAQHGPSRFGRDAVKHLPGRRKMSRSQVFQVAAELKRQQQFLSGVASRYEAVSSHDFTPLLSYSYVWNALRENRERLVDPQRRLTATQSKLIERGYDLLETDILLLFVDHQLSVLNETLELNEVQYEQVEKALSVDLNQKRALLSAKGIDSKLFHRRLHAFSEQTEKKLLAILSPEQRRIFNKRMIFHRNRLVG